MKMLIILYFMLMLSVGRCTDDQIFETTTVGVGEYVTLKCPCKSFQSMYWIRLIPGNLPEVLGKALNSKGVDSRIITTEESRTFVLRIKNTKLSDTGVYFCMQMQNILTFLKGADLKVEEPDTTAVPPSDPVRPGGSVTVTQSSVLSDSENTTGPEEQTVCCFRSESDECHLNFTNIPGNNVEEYEVNMRDSKRTTMILFPLGASLVISLIIIAFILDSGKVCNCYTGTVRTSGLQNRDLKQFKRNEDTWVYSSVVFTVMKTGSGGMADAKSAERERIYAAVKAFQLD
ncbi:uncharacterized protein LOC109138418 [Larimichthys crocea]|uniref:uncharacterized protein LOC109138418 n=1 Tax=Larimichthys crocea TaxID=215358 RepID=UPI000F5F496E|nr:uncharacterized protein LOC109138418 [Larimichthys crocea]